MVTASRHIRNRPVRRQPVGAWIKSCAAKEMNQFVPFRRARWGLRTFWTWEDNSCRCRWSELNRQIAEGS